MNEPDVSVIVLAFGAEPYLHACVDALISDVDGAIEIVVVDNGASTAVDALPNDQRVTIIRPGTNVGFAAGCGLGAEHTSGDVLVFLNSDAIAAAGAVRTLASVLDDPTIGVACGGIRLAEQPERMNSVGNPVHFLGLVWAGGYGESVAAHTVRTETPSASGAFFAVRREHWTALGGFAPEFFTYHEDTDLSLRAWLRGWRVVCEPSAVVWHHYEFSRNPQKFYFLERNRWITVLTVYPAPVLFAVLPMLVTFEVAVSVLALLQGWFPQKVRGWIWLASNACWIRRRRTAVQQSRAISSDAFAALLCARLDPGVRGLPPGGWILNRAFDFYWALVRHMIPRFDHN